MFELKDDKIKIIDIEFEIGFKIIDFYQRTFHKEFNCNSYEYSKNPIPIYLFNSYGVKFKNM